MNVNLRDLGLRKGQRAVLGPVLRYPPNENRWSAMLLRRGGHITQVFFGHVKAEPPPELLVAAADTVLTIERVGALSWEEARAERREFLATLREKGVKVTDAATDIEAAQVWVAIGGGDKAKAILAEIEEENL